MGILIAAALAADLMFSGVVVPMITPFKQGGAAVDLTALKAHADWLAGEPVSLLFPISGMGQWTALTLPEKKAMITAVIEAVKKRKPVAPGVGGGSLAITLELASFAEKAGADALTVVTPEFMREGEKPIPQDRLLEYFRDVGAKTTLPLVIYDRKAEIDPGTMLKLIDLGRVKAIKYRTTDMMRFQRMLRVTRGKIAVLTGVEHLTSAMIAAGASGVVGGGANLFPGLIAATIAATRDGRFAEAQRLSDQLMDANDVVAGSRELKFALAAFYRIPVVMSGRAADWEPVETKEREAMRTALGRWDPRVRDDDEDRATRAKVTAKAKAYADLATTTKGVLDQDGFVHNKCDGVTFTALRCIATGGPAGKCPVYAAESMEEPGLWFRHANHDCFGSKVDGSRSDNSQDEFTSLGLLFWLERDLKSVERIVRYGETHDWVMGRGADEKWPVGFRALYYDLRYRLGGADHPLRRAIDRSPASLGKGFRAHVEGNQILLKTMMAGYATDAEKAALNQAAASEPRNAFLQALAYRIGGNPIKLVLAPLMDVSLFPEGRLPSVAERCEEYLFQRGAEGDDWKPCPGKGKRPHSGTDFLWVHYLLEGSLRYN